MRQVSLLRAADRRPVPWKNGGGTTQEIAAFPAGAGMDGFGWRLSMAEVAIEGPFSTFDGVDRVLAVLEGRLSLTVMGEGRARLIRSQDAPERFPGDVPTWGRPEGAPVRDLNLMMRRGAWQGGIERLAPVGGTQVIRLSHPHVLLLANGPLAIEHDRRHALARFDILWFQGCVGEEVRAGGTDPVYIVGIEPAAS